MRIVSTGLSLGTVPKDEDESTDESGDERSDDDYDGNDDDDDSGNGYLNLMKEPE